MFTGIIERTATVSSLTDRPGSRFLRLRIDEQAGLPEWSKVTLGESIAVNGVCLTVVEVGEEAESSTVSFEIVHETLRCTALGALQEGKQVNVERSLSVGERFGGHYVTGHVDAVARVHSRRLEGDQVLFQIEPPPKLLREILPKGSVAVDGISLTVIDVDREVGRFSFAAIPHTMKNTNLKNHEPKSEVNVETDAFGKWVLHAMEELRVPPRG